MASTAAAVAAAFGPRPFTIEDAALAGISYESLKYEVASGRLRRYGRGLFSTRTAPGYLDLVRAAARLHPRAVVVGEAAAALHGMWCPRPTGWRGIVLADTACHRRYSRARLIKRSIDDVDITTVDGIRCTAPARTALDIAARTALAEGLVLVDSFGRLSGPTRQQALSAAFRDRVRSELLAAAQRMGRIHGIHRARRAASLANPAAESAPESYARGLFIAAGHPEPEVGRPVRGADGRTYYVDLRWPQPRQIVEIDGAEKYDNPAVLVAEKKREDAIRGLGYHVRRIMAGDLWRTGIATERRTA